jgi:hypothetical protein
MRSDVERQPDIAVPGQGLGHLGSNDGVFEAGVEQVATRMEIGIASSMVRVGQEVRFSRTSYPEVTRLP